MKSALSGIGSPGNLRDRAFILGADLEVCAQLLARPRWFDRTGWKQKQLRGCPTGGVDGRRGRYIPDVVDDDDGALQLLRSSTSFRSGFGWLRGHKQIDLG